MNCTNAITSPRYARRVCSDFLRFTQASKIVATERKKLSTRSRFSAVNDPTRTGGSSRFVETISFRKCEPLFKCEEAQSYRRLPAFLVSDNRFYRTPSMFIPPAKHS